MSAEAQHPVESYVSEVADEFSSAMRKHLRAHTEGTNVNAASMLATDYLNHFAEMVMQLEMLPGEKLDNVLPVLAWRPMTYEEHFERSGFRDGDLAVTAYKHAHPQVRAKFDAIVGALHGEGLATIEAVQRFASEGDMLGIRQVCEARTPKIKRLITEAADLVNGEHLASLDEIFE